MIENTQPLKIAYQFTTPGYTKVYYLHSSFSDLDVSGKAIWVDSVLQPLDTDLSKLYFFTTGHTPGSTISTEAAYYDAMVDATLLANRSGVSISDPTSVTLRQHPSISSYQVVADNVDIGVSPPVLLINLTGYADQIEVQWAPTGTTDWTTVFLGGFGSQISVPNIPIGTVDVRVQGRVIFPDGDTVEISDWQVESGIVLNWAYEPPEAPSNITFTTALLAEPSERYDVKVDWDWDIGAGSNAREFVVWSIPQSLYSSNPIGSKWSGAELVNSGTAKSVVITNHPFDREIRYRVAAISWGPEGDSTTFSSETTFTITDTTPIDSDFTTQTGIELTYSHIKGLLNDGGTWKQTFLVNAADGAVAIGLLDGNGEAPISFDPTNGIVNVKGSVISEEIIAASFVLANFTGQDNPRLYSTGKPAYGDPTKGIFMGFDNADFKYKFDLGDSTKYIRWDGDKMVISGEVVITTPGGEVPIGEGGVLVVPIYKNDTSTPPTPTDTNYPPSGWGVSPPPRSAGQNTYISSGTIDQATNALVSGESWSAPSLHSGDKGDNGSDGKSTYLASIYKRSATAPGTPTGGSYNFGTNTLTPPSGWSVSVPSGTDPVYTSSALASIVGTTGIDASLSWSAPTILSQNGQDGSDGDRGAGFFAQAIAGFNGSFNTTSANNFFTSNFGKPRVLYDVLTQYNTSDPTIATTRMWNGSSWTTAALVVHGDMIVDGTIRAEKIVASSGIINELGAEVIYDKAAFDGGSPESNYKMKIDLVNGSIHIR